MYRAFNLAKCNWDKVPVAKEVVALNETHSTTVKKQLDAFLGKDGVTLEGTQIQKHWFPQVKADVFISHSHRDCDDAIKLASFLRQSFGLDSFIDSCVWGFANDLIGQIDKQHCWNSERKTYDYEMRNRSTSHVHMMLSIALGMMIDATECAIFMNTPHAITSGEVVSKTMSPWIYYELSLMGIIRRGASKRALIENFANKKAEAKLQFAYEVPLDHLTQIDVKLLLEWDKQWGRARRQETHTHPLDLLFELAPLDND